MQTRKTHIIRAAAVTFVVATGPALAQNTDSGGILTRSLDNMPREQGGEMANEMAGETVIEIPADEVAPSPADVGEVFMAEAGDAARGEEDRVQGVDLPVGGIAARDYDPDGDPITQAATKLLDETGVLDRQRRLSEAIVLMDQRLRFNSKLEEVLVALGPDAEIEVAPGIFRSYADTPAGMRARIAQAQLEQQLAEATGTPQGEENEPQSRAEAEDLPVRDDGTGYQRMNQNAEQADEAAPGTGSAQEDRIARVEKLFEQAQARMARQEAMIRELSKDGAPGRGDREDREEPRVEDEPDAPTEGLRAVSLREIYGAAGTYAAIVEIGTSRREIRVGDEIAGGLRVSRIGPGFIDLIVDGQSTRISL